MTKQMNKQALAPSIIPLPQSETDSPARFVFLRDLKFAAQIGLYDSEQGRAQPVIINLTLLVDDPIDPLSDDPANVVCYNKIAKGIGEIIAEGHIKLVETLAEGIANLCLAHPMFRKVQVRVEKPEAIEQAAGAGVEIIRVKPMR